MAESGIKDSYVRLMQSIIAEKVGSNYQSSYPWQALQQGTLTINDFYNLLDQNAPFTGNTLTKLGMDTVRNNDGSIRAVTYYNTNGQLVSFNWNDLLEEMNSNVQSGSNSLANTFTYQTPSNVVVNETTGNIEVDGGTIKYSVDGSGQEVTTKINAGLGAVGVATVAAGVGIQLARAIDGTIYNVGEMLGLNPPRSLDPATWDSITVDMPDGILKDAFNALYCFNPLGQLELYLSEEAIGFTAMWLNEQGFFSEGGQVYPSPATSPDTFTLTSIGNLRKALGQGLTHMTTPYTITTAAQTAIDNFLSNHVGQLGQAVVNYSDGYVSGADGIELYAWPNVTQIGVQYRQRPSSNVGYADYLRLRRYRSQAGGVCTFTDPYLTTNTTAIWFGEYNISGTVYIGTGDAVESSDMPDGVTDNGGTAPDTTNWDTLDNTILALRDQYPELYQNRIENNVTQPDGTVRNYKYLPWQVPSNGEGEAPTTTIDTQGDVGVNPDLATATKLQTIIDIITRFLPNDMHDPETDPSDGSNEKNPTSTETDGPSDTGTGTGLPIVLPTGNASSLWAVYHPSQSQLNAFGAWLWSSNFVEQLKRLFNDPMQAIIGVHKVFAPIPTGGSSTIKCGFLDSGVSSPVVSSQYVDVDCGSVSCAEYFGNVFDYDPHTKVSIYLPFIGVVPLKVSEVMRSTISVTYGVDVITGACLAKVKVMRDGAGGILYSYGGSCACHYPISSGSYAGIISGIVTSAMGVAGGIATGNPLAAIGGAVAGLRQAHLDVQRSGGFTGCAGAMGPKKPYLIIDRPQTRVAAEVDRYSGKPSNATQFIGDCTGFIRAKEVHFSAPGAFDEEAREIENLLKSGVLMSD